ncbi:acylamino-acid-releasing enzyme [Platysternon megacephalum]|uniref:Acylamino-acid-releasing enzyme n=1 Tax=Platysternon megacephalum TaxID=55544 RepID=A0A4D9DQ01_9SAUR|nr:acylamino-acid-releasing enzyme [Platysternon megacephalum]
MVRGWQPEMTGVCLIVWHPSGLCVSPQDSSALQGWGGQEMPRRQESRDTAQCLAPGDGCHCRGWLPRWGRPWEQGSALSPVPQPGRREGDKAVVGPPHPELSHGLTAPYQPEEGEAAAAWAFKPACLCTPAAQSIRKKYDDSRKPHELSLSG